MSVRNAMKRYNDRTDRISKVVMDAGEPLETREVEERVKDLHLNRWVVLERLRTLAIAGVIRGKRVGSGKGVWIWYV